jgi:hypothetical protein
VAKKDPFLQQLERRRQQHLVRSTGHVDKPVTEMSGDELDREQKRLEFEVTKQQAHYWEEKRRGNLGSTGYGGVAKGGFGLASNRSISGLASVLGDLRRTRRPGWK